MNLILILEKNFGIHSIGIVHAYMHSCTCTYSHTSYSYTHTHLYTHLYIPAIYIHTICRFYASSWGCNWCQCCTDLIHPSHHNRSDMPLLTQKETQAR